MWDRVVLGQAAEDVGVEVELDKVVVEDDSFSREAPDTRPLLWVLNQS